MSFKRAGDDHCALRYQKKQRVSELMAEGIPRDEASKTRSGRFVCLVCPHHPVLDSMPMLSIHRQGNKHLTNMSVKIEKEHNLSELLQKQKQEQEYLFKESSELNTRGSNNNESLSKEISDATPLIDKTRLLAKSIVKSQGESTVGAFQGFTNEKPLSTKNKPFFQSRVELKLSKEDFQRSKTLNSTDKDCFTKSPSDVQKRLGQSLSTSVKKKVNGHAIQSTAAKAAAKLEEQPSILSAGCTREKSREMQRKYLEMRMAGWLLNSDGRWIKDENVEFDSDEDEM